MVAPDHTAYIRCYEELNDFLQPQRRKVAFPVTFTDKTSVKALIESTGVPHTEVDLILVNGEAVDFGYHVRHEDHISVYPVFEKFDITGRPPAMGAFFLKSSRPARASGRRM